MTERSQPDDAPEETRAAQHDNEKGPSTSAKVGSLIVNAAAVAVSHEMGRWLGHQLISMVIQLIN